MAPVDRRTIDRPHRDWGSIRVVEPDVPIDALAVQILAAAVDLVVGGLHIELPMMLVDRDGVVFRSNGSADRIHRGGIVGTPIGRALRSRSSGPT